MGRPPRFVIATPICDGHDVAAAAVTRMLRAQGAEAVYLGFNKSAEQIAKAASEEDADGVAVSAYNGGHMSFLRETLAQQAKHGAGRVPLFAGGGGVILEREVAPLLRMGVAKVYRPPLDLADAVRDMTAVAVEKARERKEAERAGEIPAYAGMTAQGSASGSPAYAVRAAEGGAGADGSPAYAVRRAQGGAGAGEIPAYAGMTAQESAGEDGGAFRALARRLTAIEWEGAAPSAALSDGGPPSSGGPMVWGIGGRGGAGKSTLIDELLLRFLRSAKGSAAVLTLDPTLGDRLRMTHCYSPRVFLRSVSVRPGESMEAKAAPLVAELRAAGFALILVESVGLGQNDLGVASVADASVFCMTPEYGSDVQLEKEALLSRADVIVMNKRDFPEADARAARVRRFASEGQALFLTEAKRFGDPGATALFEEIARCSGLALRPNALAAPDVPPPLPFSRRGYLGEIVEAQEAYYAEAESEAALAAEGRAERDYQGEFDRLQRVHGFDGDLSALIVEDGAAYRETPEGRVPVARETTTGIWAPALALPDRDSGPKQIVRYLYTQNLPGSFPYTEGAHRHRRRDEDPIRMFAGLGLPETTNARFHLLAAGHGAPRLSTAFDSLTLYGLDSDEPGALAKVGEGGVAVDTLDDMLRLYDGFDLGRTSVSMTINGPAPALMAMYLAAARRRGFAWRSLRGTVQADILKEAQAQNEALFPLEPSLRLIGDMTETLMREAPGWHPLSISGYHIGEAGANPVQELAFTLANGFTTSRRCGRGGCPSRISRGGSRSSSPPAPSWSSTFSAESPAAFGRSGSSGATASRGRGSRCGFTAKPPGARCRTPSRCTTSPASRCRRSARSTTTPTRCTRTPTKRRTPRRRRTTSCWRWAASRFPSSRPATSSIRRISIRAPTGSRTSRPPSSARCAAFSSRSTGRAESFPQSRTSTSARRFRKRRCASGRRCARGGARSSASTIWPIPAPRGRAANSSAFR